MLDCRGNVLSAGDLVSVASSYGHRIGTLRYDPDDLRYYTLHLDVGDRTVYLRKESRRVLNLSSLVREQLDKPFIGMLH